MLLGVLFTNNIEAIRQGLQKVIGTDLFAAEIYFFTRIPAQIETGEVAAIVAMALRHARSQQQRIAVVVNVPTSSMAREADLLPVPYFHVVFTLPAPIAAIAFQNKAVKYLEGTLAAGRGAEQARAKLTGYSGSPATIDDLSKILSVLKAGPLLAQFAEALPARINNLDGDPLVKILKALDGFAAKQRTAVPFAMALVAKRLATPWHLIRLATKETESKEAAAIAATPYAMAVTMVLHAIDEVWSDPHLLLGVRHDDGVGRVVVPDPIPWSAVASIHADTDTDADPDTDADGELAWYAPHEVPDLLP